MKKIYIFLIFSFSSLFIFSKDLTLSEAIEIALQNNLQIKIERLNLNSFQNNIKASKGVFDPILNADLESSSTKSPSSWQLQGADVYESKRRNFNLSLSQYLPTGGTFSVDWTNSRTETNSLFYFINPSYNSGFTLTISQPLLKYFGFEIAKKNEIKAIYNFNSNLSAFINNVEKKVKEVEEAYWDLYYYYNDLKVKEEALRLAKEFLSITQRRIDVGLEAPLNIYSAQVGVATREEAIIQAKSFYELAQDRLKQLLHLEKEKWNDEIKITEEPVVEKIDIEENVFELALSKRKEIINLSWQKQLAEFSLKEAKNNLLPDLNFVASYGYSGLGGTYIIRDSSGNIVEIIPGGWSDALDQIKNMDYPSWSLALTFKYPIGNRALKENLKNAELSYESLNLQTEQMKEVIFAEIREALRNLNSAEKSLEAAKISKTLAEKNLEAERKRYENGLSTNYQLLLVQKDLSEAQSREIYAKIAYKKAQINYYYKVGLLLEKNNISVSIPEFYVEKEKNLSHYLKYGLIKK